MRIKNLGSIGSITDGMTRERIALEVLDAETRLKELRNEAVALPRGDNRRLLIIGERQSVLRRLELLKKALEDAGSQRAE
ncbi:hypothetical protein [Paenibacillus mucilaginosus]|uniref:hypothetical protein n=1 Tax=Paenibacillus mucilaginosus TaxID=61624 RepID=UPI003D242F39